MCMTKSELETKVNELRSLKALKEETENEIKDLEKSIVDFLEKTEEVDTHTTNKNGKPILQYIGSDFKATYASQERDNVIKEEVQKLLSKDDYEKVVKKISYSVLRIK